VIALAPRITAQLVNESEVQGPLGLRIAFWVIAALIIGGAIATITRRNSVAAVMSLVATFFGLAAAYALLSAHFLAALEVLVYAGAIMVLFIFVVMVLNRDEVEPWAWRGVVAKGLGVGVMVYTIVKIAYYLRAVVPAHADAPPPEFGTVAEVGTVLFTDYLFAFEAVSIMLLIAVVAAVVVARHGGPTAPPASGDFTHAPSSSPSGDH
jgi:NADH-quinone oxidoreductase subunit J